jgi:Kef-type K+ transport system membrane component KefB
VTAVASLAGGLALPLAAAPRPDARSLVLVLSASAAAAILSRLHRRVRLPSVVVEIVLGIVIGAEVLDIAEVDPYIEFLANLGLVLLFFFAGLEVVEQRVPRASVVRGTGGWAISIALGLVVGAMLHEAGVDAEGWLLGVALATTALGTLVPVLSDAGLLPTPLGRAVLGTGVAGEFWPIVVISVFLTGVYGAAAEVLLLIAFGGVVALAAATALRARPPRVLRVLQETVHTTGQAAVRLSLVVLAALVLLANDVGFDFVLGAFAAGLIVGLTLDSPEGEVVRMRLEGIGFGFLIPIYFVVTGMTFDLDSLLTATGLSLAALFLALLLVVRGASSLLWFRELGSRPTLSLALFGATGLPLIVAIVGIGTDRGAIADDVGASLIGAGMLSVLAFPVIATAVSGRRTVAEPLEPVPAAAGDEY